MHRDLRDLLHSAEGQSQKVVVLFLDVRGFTSFAGIAESTDAADFLKSTYIRMLDQYFTDAVYFKLTGDGMMVIYNFTDEDTLTSSLRKAVNSSLALVQAFPSITKDDRMINFPVPQSLGVGLARGSATVISSGGKILDYTGRPLNLAARLMDLARPAGVVFDDSFGFELLESNVRNKFSKENVYIKGIAEQAPIGIYHLAGQTRIREQNKFPMNSLSRFTEDTETKTLGELIERGASFRHLLAQQPARTDDIEVHLKYEKIKSDGTRHPTMRWTPSYKAKYKKAQNKHYAVFNYKSITEKMQAEDKTELDWEVEVTIEYSIRAAITD